MRGVNVLTAEDAAAAASSVRGALERMSAPERLEVNQSINQSNSARGFHNQLSARAALWASGWVYEDSQYGRRY